MHAASSAPLAGLHPDRWRTNPIADEVQAASSRSGSFSNQVCTSILIGHMLTPSRLYSPEHQEIFNAGVPLWLRVLHSGALHIFARVPHRK